ncbi:coiled-coil domain-containing protein 124-like isoform X2 [Limulus polyphemus]|uniref:Coiled-coil domain-containing protein 124-like isoform X2 n=1 Tax=Limulus polyphemus TaxID=6850 RepID=A0ABM1S9J5_LIMPO|nr:coiled-coil domain-containing protein 124-like isoform X2 [Limulus polyphemus]
MIESLPFEPQSEFYIMPKKMGTNTKAVEARARKEEAKRAEKEKKEKAAEDALWEDNDKYVVRKQKRKEEKEKKKQEQSERKTANKVALQEEMENLKSENKYQLPKVTRADISKVLEQETEKKNAKKNITPNESPLEENINRLPTEGEEARSVEEAIAVLSVKEAELDRHPERRMKAAWEAFEEANLPKVKAENPNLRLSQLKQLLKKQWMKSPENPLNQRHQIYNMKK